MMKRLILPLLLLCDGASSLITPRISGTSYKRSSPLQLSLESSLLVPPVDVWTALTPPSSSIALALSTPDLDLPFVLGSLLWALNLYFGFDWLLAPLGLDNDFNPAARTTVAFGRLLAGRDLLSAAAPIVDTDGERPELGSRLGTGANQAYALDLELEDGRTADWLTDREAGLRSEPPIWLRAAVALTYLLCGVLVTTLTDAESGLTAGVFAVIACVYEVGRPTLPTREEARSDAALDRAVADFVERRVVRYGEDLRDLEGVVPVRIDEAVNERELCKAFREATGYGVDDFPDFQIELRMRSYGTGRSVAGYVKGLRLLPQQKSAY